MMCCQDYLVAMSLQQEQGEAPGPLSDLELARQLQQEEYQQPQTQQQTSTGQVLSKSVKVFFIKHKNCLKQILLCLRSYKSLTE